MVTPDNPTEQSRLLQFALRWLPFVGGSAEDIFVEFGLSEQAFYVRLTHVLAAVGKGLPPKTRVSLRAACEQHLGYSRGGQLSSRSA